MRRQASHGIPYAAQTTFIGNFKDISEKAHKAIYTPGAAFLNIMAPCPRGWRYPSEKLMEVTKAAVETCVWPLYEVIDGKHEGMKIVDMSSIAPLATKEIGKACQLAGVPLLESPVSGGEQGAINGTLSLMVGGDRTLFEELKPILKIMATNIMLCGDLGAGNTTKLINQHILAVEIAGIAEAFTMGKKAGVDPRVVYEAIHNGAAGSKIMDLKLPTVFDRNFKPGFRLDLHIKDLNNALETGYAIGSPMPLGSAVMDMMKFMSANGHGGEDHSTLMQYYEQIANVQITSENQK